MSAPKASTVEVNGFPCRVWTKGSGPKLGFLAGLGGLPRWLPFLDKLAETRTVIVPSLPGYPGAAGHTELDSHLDWVVAVRQLIDKAGLAGADLVGASVGGIPAVVVDGECGRLVPPEDPEALARALVELGRDEPLREKLGEAAIARAEAFSTAVAEAKMRAVYEALVREKRIL